MASSSESALVCSLRTEVESLRAENKQLRADLEDLRYAREAQSWLAQQNFVDGDLRSEITINQRAKCPMAFACQKGKLVVCKWLYEHGAAEDIRRPNRTASATPMFLACQEGRLSVCEWLLKVGAGEDVSTASNKGNTPMIIACWNGHDSICRWLFEMGAAGDITKANNDGVTPMYTACQEGRLSICKWLFEVGAASDVTRANNDGDTPMWIACKKGHLSVCQWLFAVGAAADITRANGKGVTPMYIACHGDRVFIWQWLVFNGAFNHPAEGHVSHNAVSHDVQTPRHRAALLSWARELVIRSKRIFLDVVLRASVLVPMSQQHLPPQHRCRLPMLERSVLEVVGSFLGVKTGRPLRNVSELIEALAPLEPAF